MIRHINYVYDYTVTRISKFMYTLYHGIQDTKYTQYFSVLSGSN